MRGTAALVLSLAIVPAAQASSIVAIGTATDTPSVVAPGQPPAKSGTAANFYPEAGNARAAHVLVIRAGIVGSASAAPAASRAKAAGGGKTQTLRDAMTQAGQATAVPQ